MPIKLNGSTSGYVNLDVPAVSGTTNLTLPLYGFGKILQVQQGVITSVVSATTETWKTSGCSATITPASTASKIFVSVSAEVGSAHASDAVYLDVFRNGSSICPIASRGFVRYYSATATQGAMQSFQYLDSPASTSALTYDIRFMGDGFGTVYLGRLGINQTYIQPTIITLMEVGP